MNGNCHDDGTNIHLWEKNGGAAQKWIFEHDGSIIHQDSGKALDISGGGHDDGTNIQLWERNGTGAQKWQIVSHHDCDDINEARVGERERFGEVAMRIAEEAAELERIRIEEEEVAIRLAEELAELERIRILEEEAAHT